MSKGNKSSTLWNVLDPDDPYDIKKSMIAKLPDHPPQPMGRHLELVCLLQAAQIERLTDYLTEMKSKYREMQRRELDRHSYEVQIKELAEKNISLNNLKQENERLREFIRRQGIQLEELQKKSMASVNLEALQAKYEGLLNELRISRTQNENSEKTIARLNVEINEWRMRFEKVEQERIAFTSQFQIQWREKLNIEVKAARERAEERADRLQVEVRQLKEVIDNKNHEIQSLAAQRDQFAREIRLLEEKNKNKGNIEEVVNDKNREIQRLNNILAEITSRLEQTTASSQRLGGELNILEERYRNIQKQREKLIIRIRQFQSMKLKSDNLQRMEEKVAMMSMEIERLNGLNAARARECADANGEIEKLKYQLRNSQSSKQQLERERQKVSKLESEIEILKVSESRVRILTEEMERIRVAFNSKNEEVYALQQRLNVSQVNTIEVTTLTKEKVRLEQELQLSLQKIQGLKATINANQTSALDLAKIAKERSSLEQQLQAARSELRNYKTITDSELTTLRTENQRLRQELDHNSVNRSEYEKYRVETQRLRAEIQRIRGESINIRKYFEEEKASNIRIQNERNNLMNENQNMLNELLHLKKEIEGLKSLAKILDEKERLSQGKELQITNLQQINNNLTLQLYESKGRNDKLEASIENIYHQIQRLHSILSTKVNENQKIARDNAQLQEKCKFLESKLAGSSSEREYYEKEITRLKQEVDNTAKMSNDASRDLMARVNDFLLEKEKADRLIAQKDKLISEYTREKESLERKLVEVQREFSLKITVQEQLRNEINQIRIERERFYEELRIKETTIIQLQTVIREKESFGRQSDGKVKMWESRVTEWQSRLKDAEKGIQVREEEVNRHKRENERLNAQIQKFSQELQEIVKQRDVIIGQNNQLKRRIQELMRDEKSKFAQEQLRNQLKMAEEALFRQRKQLETVRNSYKTLEENFTRQTREFQVLKINVREYQQKIVHIQTTQTRILEQRIQDYDRKLQERDNLVITLERKVKQMETQLGSVVARDQDALNNLNKYEEKITLLSVELERLKQRLITKEKECREKDSLIEEIRQRPTQPDHQTLQKLRQCEANLSFYGSQNEKLKTILNQRDREINEKNITIETLTLKINQANSSIESQTISRYKIQLTNLQTALEEFQNINMHTIAQRDQLFKVSHELKDQLDQLAARSAETEKHLRNELSYRLEENRRFGEELGSLKKNEQSLILKLEEYQRTLANKNEERILRGRIGQLQGQLQAHLRENNELRNQNANLRQQINQLMIINQELNIRIGESSSQSRDQFSRITTKVKELTLLLQSKDEQMIEWQQKYSAIFTAYEQLYHNYQINKAESEVTIANIKTYEAKLFKIEDDYQALANALRTRDQELHDLRSHLKANQDLYQKNIVLSKEIDRLTEANRKLQGDVSELRLVMTDNVSLQKRLEQQLALMVVLFAEIQSLRSRLINSENQCQEVRRSSIAPCRVDRERRS